MSYLHGMACMATLAHAKPCDNAQTRRRSATTTTLLRAPRTRAPQAPPLPTKATRDLRGGLDTGSAAEKGGVERALFNSSHALRPGARAAAVGSASARDTTPAVHTFGESASCHAAQFCVSTMATALSRLPACVALYCTSLFVQTTTGCSIILRDTSELLQRRGNARPVGCAPVDRAVDDAAHPELPVAERVEIVVEVAHRVHEPLSDAEVSSAV